MVGTIAEPAALDRSGWSAGLQVERELAPGAIGAPATGQRLVITWEELAPARPPRFAAGDRVLLALVPLPDGSLWRQRFPRRDALAVGGDGHAFLRAPDEATIEGVTRWRTLSALERDGTPGAAALAGLVARGGAPLAEAAVARLAEIPGLATRLDETAVADLTAALTVPGRPDAVRLALLGITGAQRIDALRPAVVARTTGGPPLAAAAWEALADLDGGLPEETLRRLLASDDPEVRAVAARRAAGTPLEARAAELARRDPAPIVRAAAVGALVGTRQPKGIELAFDALSDSAPEVRGAAAQGLGAIGPEVVPRLLALAQGTSGPTAAGAITALSYAGAEGRDALHEIGESHPDPATRQLARLFSGEEIHQH